MTKSTKPIGRPPEPRAVTPPEAVERSKLLYTRIMEESPLKSDLVKEALAQTTVVLLEQIARVRDAMASGNIGAHEARSLPAIASNLRTQLQALELLNDKADEEDVADFIGG